MNIKFKNLLKSCLLGALVFISCDNDDLDDSGLELGIKPFDLENLNGGKSFRFEIDETPDFLTGLSIKNKITNQENVISNFLISQTVTEGDIVKNKIIRIFETIEQVREFNFDMGNVSQFRVWSLRYPTGSDINIPSSDQILNSDFSVNQITGDNFGLTEFEDAIIVNVVEKIIPLPPPPPAPEPIPGLLSNFDDVVLNFDTIDGSAFEVVDNPFISGTNSIASRVGKLTNNGISEFESFQVDLPEPINFSTQGSRIFTAKVYSTVSTIVEFQVRNGVDNAKEASKSVTHGGTGWEDMVFDFTTGADGLGEDGGVFIPNSGSFESLRIIIDGPGTNDGEFYVDDISYIVYETLIDFDDLNVSFSPFNDANYMRLDNNPFISGNNNIDSRVGRFENTGIQEFEGFSADLEGDSPIDFGSNSNKTIILKMYSTISVPVDFQVTKGADNARAAAKTVTHGGTGWELLEFDFKVGAIKTFDGSADAGESFVPEGVFAGITILIDGSGNATGVYIIDDIQLKLN